MQEFEAVFALPVRARDKRAANQAALVLFQELLVLLGRDIRQDGLYIIDKLMEEDALRRVRVGKTSVPLFLIQITDGSVQPGGLRRVLLSAWDEASALQTLHNLVRGMPVYLEDNLHDRLRKLPAEGLTFDEDTCVIRRVGYATVRANSVLSVELAPAEPDESV